MIERQAPEIERRAINEVLLKALQDAVDGNSDISKVFKSLEVQAGIATYDRFIDFRYPKFEYVMDEDKFSKFGFADLFLPFVSDVKFKGWDEERIESLPNHHQPYFKFRYTDGKSISPVVYDPDATGVYFGCDNKPSETATVYVNSNAQGASDGSQERPYRSVTAGVDCVKKEGTVWITEGTYDESLLINQPMTLRSSGDTVTIKATHGLGPISSEPKLLFSTTRLNLNTTVGGPNPAVVSIPIGRSGSGVLTWTANTSQSWLSVTPTSGAAPATIQLSVNSSGLQEGIHNGDISVTSGSVTIKRPVRLNIAAKPDAAVLQIAPSLLNFLSVEADKPPANQSISITNGGDGELNWSATTSDSWLKVSPASGTAPSTIVVHIDSNGLADGDYIGEIQIKAGGQTETISVNLKVESKIASAKSNIYLPLIKR